VNHPLFHRPRIRRTVDIPPTLEGFAIEEWLEALLRNEEGWEQDKEREDVFHYATQLELAGHVPPSLTSTQRLFATVGDILRLDGREITIENPE